ncbi:MAG: hypothetical protein IPL02_09235 [Moraxellaceae bacterium]|nr:hypothetical protein [Moraxellaceae bacterium]
MQKILAQESDKGWRLPTFEESKTLIITTRIGYITKEGFDFYEIQELRFTDHWLTIRRRLNHVRKYLYGKRKNE